MGWYSKLKFLFPSLIPEDTRATSPCSHYFLYPLILNPCSFPKFWASPVNFKSSSSLSYSLEEPCWYPDGAGTISKSRISTAIELDEPLIGNEAPRLLWVSQLAVEIGGYGWLVGAGFWVTFYRERSPWEREIIRIDFFGVLVFILFFIFLIGGVVN